MSNKGTENDRHIIDPTGDHCIRCGCAMKFDSVKGWVDMNGDLYKVYPDGTDDHCHIRGARDA